MKHLLSFLLFSPPLLFAQATIKGVITNINREALPLTNIVSMGRSIGTITNEKGEFMLSNLLPGDSIKISNIAYQAKIIAIKDWSNTDTLFLGENIKQLNEIVVRNLSVYRQETALGFYNYANNGAFRLMPGNQIALYIANEQKKEGWIKAVSFRVKEWGKCKNSMRIRILQMDTLKFSPSIDLLDEQVLIKSADLKKSNYIDLSSYKIIFPKEGIFIVLEWVYPDYDCDKNSYTSISANLSTPKNIVWFNFRDKAWNNKARQRLPNGNYNTPNIGLTVAF